MNPSSELDPWEAATIPDLIRTECEKLAGMLIEKNNAYGNSALDPVRIFSTADPVEQIKVRIDDKLSRLKRGNGDGEDTVLDLIGYLILLRIAQREPARAPQKFRETPPPSELFGNPERLAEESVRERLRALEHKVERLGNHVANLDSGYSDLDDAIGAMQTAIEDMPGDRVEPVGNPDKLPRHLDADDPEPPAGSVVLDRGGFAWQSFGHRWTSVVGGRLLWSSSAFNAPRTLVHEGAGE